MYDKPSQSADRQLYCLNMLTNLTSLPLLRPTFTSFLPGVRLQRATRCLGVIRGDGVVEISAKSGQENPSDKKTTSHQYLGGFNSPVLDSQFDTA